MVVTLRPAPPGSVKVGQPGDFILVHSVDWASRLIRFGQRVRFRGARRPFAYWNHAAIFVDGAGSMVEADWHVKRLTVSDYRGADYVVVHRDMTDADRAKAAEYAHLMVGAKYGIAVTLAAVARLLTGTRFEFGIDGHPICSALVARALDGRPTFMPRDPSHMLPADLAELYGVLPA
jgi:hypothetical protein